MGLSANAGAFEIPTGNDDLRFRWDNTFRYTLAQRVKGQNDAILNSPQNDDGDRNFDVGIVSNRLDILSEADLTYKRSYGVRVSGAGWYDQRYHNHLDNTSAATSNHLVNGAPAIGLSSYVERYYAGPSGELLDAFVFGKFDIGDVPVNVKVGRHTVYWGESFLPQGGTNGISYAQSPIDRGKGLAQPGVELKEIFRPLNQISIQAQPSRTLSIAAQYYLQWESDRFPEGGSYLGFADMYKNGGESIVGPGFINGGDITPKQARDWGIMARWNPDWLDGTLGFYYRNFSDKLPQLLVQPGAGTYHFAYASGIDLFGISLAKQVLGISVGSEISYRLDMPLVSQQGIPVGLPGTPAVPGTGETAGARGDTWHAVINFLGILPKTPLFDTGSWLAEFTWGGWTHVRQGNEFFLGREGYGGLDRVTKDAISGAINFAPTWFQVLPGVDLSMPLSVSMGLTGNSAVTAGGDKNNGSYSAGLSFDIFAKYKADLNYVGFFGNFRTDSTGGITSSGDIFALLKDRDMVSLTLKTTF
jgi:hypothetical protein